LHEQGREGPCAAWKREEPGIALGGARLRFNRGAERLYFTFALTQSTRTFAISSLFFSDIIWWLLPKIPISGKRMSVALPPAALMA
jgi:hypothetical protein